MVEQFLHKCCDPMRLVQTGSEALLRDQLSIITLTSPLLISDSFTYVVLSHFYCPFRLQVRQHRTSEQFIQIYASFCNSMNQTIKIQFFSTKSINWFVKLSFSRK